MTEGCQAAPVVAKKRSVGFRRGRDETGRRVAGGSEQAAERRGLSGRTLRRREERVVGKDNTGGCPTERAPAHAPATRATQRRSKHPPGKPRNPLRHPNASRGPQPDNSQGARQHENRVTIGALSCILCTLSYICRPCPRFSITVTTRPKSVISILWHRLISPCIQLHGAVEARETKF